MFCQKKPLLFRTKSCFPLWLSLWEAMSIRTTSCSRLSTRSRMPVSKFFFSPSLTLGRVF